MEREEYKFIEEVCEKYGREKAIIKIDFNSKQIKKAIKKGRLKKIEKKSMTYKVNSWRRQMITFEVSLIGTGTGKYREFFEKIFKKGN